MTKFFWLLLFAAIQGCGTPTPEDIIGPGWKCDATVTLPESYRGDPVDLVFTIKKCVKIQAGD